MTVMHRHKVVVATKDEHVHTFPVDMLRYDGLAPFNEHAVLTIMKIDLPVPGRSGSVTLVKNGHKDWKPTDHRWRSFGWHVASHTSVKD